MSESPVQHATVIGDGAMGTVCALILAHHDTQVYLWGNFPDQVAETQANRENKRFLPGHKLPDSITVTNDASLALAHPELIISAVPCQYTRSVWKTICNHYTTGTPVCSVTKGIELETLCRPSEILRDILSKQTPVCCLSGPSIAPEVARGLPVTLVAAAEDESLARLVQYSFSTPSVRVYTNTDLVGVELAGATKNVIAIAAGIIDGMKLGDNAKAALLTRGSVEIARLGQALGAQPDTFKGLAGIGDLITTCISPVGRNRSAGDKIGQGMTAREVIASTESVIEGIPTTDAVMALADANQVELPVIEAVQAVLHGTLSPADAISALMTRRLKSE